jgi:RNA-binding protein
MIGQHGLTDSVINEIDLSLDHHELIKIKLAGADKSDRDALSAAIIERVSAELVQVIGRIAIFYRANPNKKKNRIII